MSDSVRHYPAKLRTVLHTLAIEDKKGVIKECKAYYDTEVAKLGYEPITGQVEKLFYDVMAKGELTLTKAKTRVMEKINREIRNATTHGFRKGDEPYTFKF